MNTLKWLLMSVIVLAGVVAFAGSASSEPRIDTMPNCPERWNGTGSFGPGQKAFDTPAEAAEDVRQAIIEGGGRGNGLVVESLVALDELTFSFPIVDTPEVDADGVITVEGRRVVGIWSPRTRSAPGRSLSRSCGVWRSESRVEQPTRGLARFPS
jgi:hypothetical protein